MRRTRNRPILTGAAAAFIGVGAIAGAGVAAASQLTRTGRQVMDKASQSNIAEIEEGRLALTHSKEPLIQALGNRLVQDHSKAQATLEALAASLHVKLPTRPNAKQRQQIAQLGTLKDTAFDRLFAASEVGAHRKTIGQMDRAASAVKNPALEAWVKQSIPVLQEHLQLAQNLPSQLAITRAAQAAGATPATRERR